MLNIIGLGLRGIKSITRESLEVLKECDIIYFETYTSISPISTVSDIESLVGRKVKTADRDFIETGATLLQEADQSDVCLLVTGDPLSATTHNQIRLEAMEKSIDVRIFENSSIINVIPGMLGLMHYRFGPPVSIPFVSRNFFPLSTYDKIEKNISLDLHTILLLDLKDGKTMPVQEAIGILEEMERRRKKGILEHERDMCVVISVSQPGERLVFGTLGSIKKSGIEGNPAALVIPSRLNDSEEIFLNRFAERL